jgi:hypothetical protein
MVERLEDFPQARVGASSYRRPLLYANLSEVSTDALFLGLVETNPDFHGQGIGVALYRELKSLAGRGGYRFLGHYHNHLETAGFFLRRGCYFLEEIRPELRHEFRALREQEDDPSVFHTVAFVDASDAERYVPEDVRRLTVDQRLQRRKEGRTRDNAPVASLHFLVHPLFVSDPAETDGWDADQDYKTGEALRDLYLEKARSLPETGVLFLFSHLDPVRVAHDYPAYRALYRGFLHSLKVVLGDRLFLRSDAGVFDDLKVAGSLNAEMRRRGFKLDSNPSPFAYGEVPELCVADAAENLREGFDLEKEVVIETRYSSWQAPYGGEYPKMEEELRERGLRLK